MYGRFSQNVYLFSNLAYTQPHYLSPNVPGRFSLGLDFSQHTPEKKFKEKLEKQKKKSIKW